MIAEDKIIGIDMSFRNTGVAIVRRVKIEGRVTITLSDKFVIKTKKPNHKSKILNLEEEIDNISLVLESKLLGMIYVEEPDHVIVEVPDRSQSHASSYSMGICHTMLAALKYSTDCPPDIVFMDCLKKWSNSRKGDAKDRVKEKVLESFPSLDTNDHNIIDAIGLCLVKCDELSVLGL